MNGEQQTYNYLSEIIASGARSRQWSSFAVFAISLLIYILTADRSASFWDCPEYITCASRLEVGHPPGNPIWMLAMRVITSPLPQATHPFAINLASGLMTALAAFFLSRLSWLGGAVIAGKRHRFIPVLSALAGGLSFAFCDSVWFSAVEAEVYAMSAFLSLLSLWLLVRWWVAPTAGARSRLLILIAYIMGLSLGVHQLNLLIIPVISLVIYFRFHPQGGNFTGASFAFLGGCGGVALILFGMMNGTLYLAGRFEIISVNQLGMPLFSGVLIYATLIIILFCLTLPNITYISKHRNIAFLLYFLLIFLSGIFLFSDHTIIAIILSVISASALAYPLFSRRIVANAGWCLAFILLGFSSFALILIRGYAAPPMNEGAPTDIFALSSYLARDQYGSTPLLYGPTPFSKALLKEDYQEGKDTPVYSRIVLEKRKPRYVLARPEGRLGYRSGFVSNKEDAENYKLLSSGKPGYVLADYSYRSVTTPELNIWLPRITSSLPSHIESYGDWAGMTEETMTKVEASATLDSLGHPVGKIGNDGKRVKSVAYRPTYLQNLRYFLAYQVGYMYLRYLGWNFIGRQNDIPSTGEIEHGNVITGFSFIDNAMLGNQNFLPPEQGMMNKGRNVYYAIPFIIGIFGIVALCRKGKAGKRWAILSSLLFLMTGLAIVVYLNQTPGEPRERDYSFLVSYAVFAFWIGCGVAKGSLIFVKLFPIGRALPGIILATLSPALLFVENFDDHDRRERGEPLHLTSDMLEAMPASVIFTQGDNYTFPLWFTQETMGIGKKHCVIDLTYLSLPDYVVNLMRQGNLPITARPEDIAYGAFAFTRIAEDADTVPIPLIDALHALYADKDGAPTFRHSRVVIPGATAADTLLLNLNEFAGGGRYIPFRKLMILDILASSLQMPDPIPLRFINRCRSDIYRPILPAVRKDSYSFVYSPYTHPSALDNPGRPTPSHPRYADPLLHEMVRQRRGELVATAERIASSDAVRAAALLYDIENAYPLEFYPPGDASIGDSIFHEGERMATLLYTLAAKNRRQDLRQRADLILSMLISEAESWNRFITSLPPSRRNTVSNSSRLKASRLSRLRSLKASPAYNDSIETNSPATDDSLR
ncbi:MAG: DUF2723 domain-containing protein [Muribaculaceae bacterium]|nr:DUF2723 domain-containing protein [Muribaculaceae bacterium]